MTNPFFNTSIFANPDQVWQQQIFAKKFDAFYFVEYPYNQYGQEGALNPFHFLNNLQEKTLTISTPDGKKSQNFENKDWRFEAFFADFEINFSQERFLFWYSEKEKWAMLSDKKTGISLYGIDWKVAEQVGYIYENGLLSPEQAAVKLDITTTKNEFFERYAPSKILTEGNEENPIWVKYYFQCRVENEDDKLFYWAQFEPMFHAISAVLADFKSVDMYADQAFWRRYKQKGQIYASGKNAPVGGWQKYNFDNCKKVATKFLSQNQHLQFTFEGKTDESEQLYFANKNGLIEFMVFWIYANVEKTKVKGMASDFYFQMTSHSFGNKNDEFNQNFEFSYRKSLLNENIVADLVQKMEKIAFAKKVHRMENPSRFATYSSEKPLKIEGMYGALPDL